MMIANLLRIEIQAESLAEAVELGLRHFNCSRTEMETDILQAPTSGFLGRFGAKQARVCFRLTDRNAAACIVCQRLLDLAGLEARVERKNLLDPCLLKLESADPSLLIGRHGQTLDSLQNLLNALLDKQLGHGEPVVLDTAAYRERRKTDLVSMAQRLVAKVRKTGQPVSTPPLPTEERKVLHGFFEREVDIVARSKGQGAEKKLVVSARG